MKKKKAVLPEEGSNCSSTKRDSNLLKLADDGKGVGYCGLYKTDVLNALKTLTGNGLKSISLYAILNQLQNESNTIIDLLKVLFMLEEDSKILFITNSDSECLKFFILLR